MPAPPMYRLHQTFPRPRIEDPAGLVREQIRGLGLDRGLGPGARVGITVGSRGIANIALILRSLAEGLREMGFDPVFLAAMGSHGNGSASGQEQLLNSLGLTPETLGAPLICCDTCTRVAETASGLPAYVVTSALDVDAILPVNRVKAHTSLRGPIESGLVKMMAVGLGGPAGATLFHGLGQADLPRQILELGQAVMNALPIPGGLAIVENAWEETADIRGLPRDALFEGEAALLATAKTLMPSLPCQDIDLLIIERIGKNISGTGMDTNVVGRNRIQGSPEPQSPRIKRVAVLDLSPESHGNATGLGLADFTTARLVAAIDRQATYKNCLTTTFIQRAAIPMYFETDRELVEAALQSLSATAPDRLRVVVIADTLHLGRCLVSQTLAEELSGRPGTDIKGEPLDWTYDPAGSLTLRAMGNKAEF